MRMANFLKMFRFTFQVAGRAALPELEFGALKRKALNKPWFVSLPFFIIRYARLVALSS